MQFVKRDRLERLNTGFIVVWHNLAYIHSFKHLLKISLSTSVQHPRLQVHQGDFWHCFKLTSDLTPQLLKHSKTQVKDSLLSLLYNKNEFENKITPSKVSFTRESDTSKSVRCLRCRFSNI